MFDYIINYDLKIGQTVLNEEVMISFENYYDIDFRDEFIMDNLKELHNDEKYDEIIITDVKSLVDRNVNVENIADKNWYGEI
ncbi:hypothetical protein [Clostridium botulinum]|uniref:hypothetical protein n=1 Tax=Clostridium botulinum TaxID=1491 RepID=UPI001C9B54B2|nr:hypothetical protein [Clostridium botulinum]MBY6838660.1 hypothetical protein [Clostridium botulinum]